MGNIRYSLSSGMMLLSGALAALKDNQCEAIICAGKNIYQFLILNPFILFNNPLSNSLPRQQLIIFRKMKNRGSLHRRATSE